MYDRTSNTWWTARRRHATSRDSTRSNSTRSLREGRNNRKCRRVAVSPKRISNLSRIKIIVRTYYYLRTRYLDLLYGYFINFIYYFEHVTLNKIKRFLFALYRTYEGTYKRCIAISRGPSILLVCGATSLPGIFALSRRESLKRNRRLVV